MLFPVLVDGMQQDRFFKSFHQCFRPGIIRFFQVAGDIIYPFPVGNGDQDIFIHGSLVLIDLFDDRMGNFSKPSRFTFKGLKSLGGHIFQLIVLFHLPHILFLEGDIERHHTKQIEFHPFVIILIHLHNILCGLRDHVGDIVIDTFTHQGMTAAAVNHLTLGVHHIVVLQQPFTDTEVVFLHLLLGALYRFTQHIVFQYVSLFESHPVHETCNPLGSKETHQIVFQGNKENARPGISLASGTSS